MRISDISRPSAIHSLPLISASSVGNVSYSDPVPPFLFGREASVWIVLASKIVENVQY